MKAKKYLLWIGLGLFDLLVLAYLGAGWYFSESIISFPRPPAEGSRPKASSVFRYDLPAPEEIQLQSAGVTLAGWYFDLPGDVCGAALFHGHGGDRSSMLRFSQLFQPYGCDLVMIDFRHHGASGGDANTFGAYERQDVLAALEYLQQRTGLPDQQLALVGISYGAAAILQAAPQRPQLAFILADSPYRSLPAIITVQAEQRYGAAILPLAPGALAVSGLRAWFNPWDVSPEDSAAHIAAPVFLLHEAQDSYTPASHSQAIYDRIPHDRKALYLVNWSGKHGGALGNNPREYHTLLDAFIQQYAPQFPAAAR